jgi:hypothetical protein
LWSAQPASAAITRWAKWKVDFAFPNNQMDLPPPTFHP